MTINPPEITFDQDEGHVWDLSITPWGGGFTHRWKLDTDTAIALWRRLDATIGDYVREGERERAAYERATPAERAQVLGVDVDPVELVEGYAPDDPKRVALLEHVDAQDVLAEMRGREPWEVQWLRPGDPQAETLMYRWTAGDRATPSRFSIVHRVAGPGSTWGPPETIFTDWTLDAVRQIAVERGFTAEQTVAWR